MPKKTEKRVKEFDKDKALAEYRKRNPDFADSCIRKQPLPITTAMLEQVIALYPVTNNLSIAEIVGLEYNQLYEVIKMLKEKGIVLGKKSAPTRYSKFEEAFNGLSLPSQGKGKKKVK